jgi:hypothetical protein
MQQLCIIYCNLGLTPKNAWKKIIRNGKTTKLSTHQQPEAKYLKDQNTMLLFSCCCQQTMVSTSSQDADSSLLTNSRWLYHQTWKQHTKGIIFLYVEPILGRRHHEEVVWITTVLEILALSIIKAKWLPHGPCQYIQHTSTIYTRSALSDSHLATTQHPNEVSVL